MAFIEIPHSGFHSLAQNLSDFAIQNDVVSV